MTDVLNKSKKRGFTMIEALTVLFIFSLITISFYSMISIGSRHIINAKNRLGALSLANEKMEIARNIKYDDLGTDTGAVSGVLKENEDVAKSTRLYHVHTLVEYIRDTFDGDFPADVAWNDYKKVTVEVSWNNGNGGTDKTTLVSRFVPPGLEVPDPNAGILVINVFSDQPGGVGIPYASVHVVNSDTGLDTNFTTDDSGSYALMGDKVTNSIQKYQIIVTKDGYETAQTYPPYPDTAYNPVDVHASVVVGSMNVANIVQNELADMTVETVDYLDQGIAGIQFEIIGGRKLGTDVVDPLKEYFSLESTETTNSSGEKELNDISPGKYTIEPQLASTNYELIGIQPLIPLQLLSSSPQAVKIRLADKTKTGMIIKVVKDGTNPIEPLENATVTITKGVFTDNLTTLVDGAVYFPKDTTPLEAGTYDVHVTASGYVDNDFQINVSDGTLSAQTVSMVSS